MASTMTASGLIDFEDNDLSIGEISTWYRDRDEDGMGPARPIVSCEPLNGGVTNDDDCDDTRASVAPGFPELCNGPTMTAMKLLMKTSMRR